MINSIRSERGWRGRRRIAVLVSIAGVLGVVALSSAGTASAATVANCNAKLEPKGNVSSTKAKLTFVCDGPVRTYTVGATSAIKSYSASNVPNFVCEGVGVGFGCGVSDRAAPGTQTPGTTGWETKPPPPNAGGSLQDHTPTTCNGFKRVAGQLVAGTASDFPPNLTAVVTPTCSQIISAGTKVTQSLKFKQSPCSGTQVNLLVGGEPLVTSFIAPNSHGGGGESSTVGEYLQAPSPVSMKAYKRCLSGGSGGANGVAGAKKSGATASGIAPTKFPVACGGSIVPATTPGDATLTFQCSQNIRAFAVYSNRSIDLPGDEPIVTGPSGGGANEGALHQCEGLFPGPGYGCGIVDRQAQTTTLPNGQGISAGNTATQKMGFESTPCKRAGEPKPKAWLVAMGEPTTSASTVGEFSSQPFPLAISGFSCKGGGKKKH